MSEEATVKREFKFYTGRDIPGDWLNLYTQHFRNHGLEVLREAIVNDHGEEAIRSEFKLLIGRDIPGDWLNLYKQHLRNHGMDVVRGAIISDHRSVDLWIAFNAFASKFPNKIKRPAGESALKIHKEVSDGPILWMYEYFGPSPPGAAGNPAPVWNAYSKRHVGNQECIVCDMTIPNRGEATWWKNGVPRSAVRGDFQIEQDTHHHHSVQWYFAHQDFFILSFDTVGAEWGRRYKSRVKDLSDERSQENMGNRWIVEMSYKTTEEFWAVDLGPEIGVFDPRYGIVRYHHTFLTNIQDDPGGPEDERVHPRRDLLPKRIALKATVNNKWVCAENGGNSPLIANRANAYPGAGSWEIFEVVTMPKGPNRIALRSTFNGKFVCAENGGNSPLIANRANAYPGDANGNGSCEVFEVEPMGRKPPSDRNVPHEGMNRIALKATINGKYVCAEDAGASALIANRTNASPGNKDGDGSWEIFEYKAI